MEWTGAQPARWGVSNDPLSLSLVYLYSFGPFACSGHWVNRWLTICVDDLSLELMCVSGDRALSFVG